ncbi:MAG: hypothetical protein OEL78_03060, partial [Hyphomicrobiales bacterium]|nr:hypothetical protein [Hyphomicrobiales bacterium]
MQRQTGCIHQDAFLRRSQPGNRLRLVGIADDNCPFCPRHQRQGGSDVTLACVVEDDIVENAGRQRHTGRNRKRGSRPDGTAGKHLQGYVIGHFVGVYPTPEFELLLLAMKLP